MQQDKKIKQDAAAFLGLLGFTVVPSDALLGLCLRRASEYICNATNQREIPAGLHMAAVYRVAGEWLRLRHLSGGLSEAEMENAAAAATKVTEIRESEVTVKFQADQTAEQKFVALIESLTLIDGARLARWRRLTW